MLKIVRVALKIRGWSLRATSDNQWAQASSQPEQWVPLLPWGHDPATLTPPWGRFIWQHFSINGPHFWNFWALWKKSNFRCLYRWQLATFWSKSPPRPIWPVIPAQIDSWLSWCWAKRFSEEVPGFLWHLSPPTYHFLVFWRKNFRKLSKNWGVSSWNHTGLFVTRSWASWGNQLHGTGGVD